MEPCLIHSLVGLHGHSVASIRCLPCGVVERLRYLLPINPNSRKTHVVLDMSSSNYQHSPPFMLAACGTALQPARLPKLSNWPSRALPMCLPLGQACSTDTRDWCTLCDYGRDTTVPGLPPTSLLGYPLVLEYCAVGNAVTCSNVLMTSIKSHLQELFRVFQVPFRNP